MKFFHLAIIPKSARIMPFVPRDMIAALFLVAAKQGTDYDEFFRHWLDVHVPNVQGTMEKVGGFRYVVSHSMTPEEEPYAGMAELYFPNADGWDAYREHIKPDGMERWVDGGRMAVLRSDTEMVGIP